jgi:hypothetical protein
VIPFVSTKPLFVCCQKKHDGKFGTYGEGFGEPTAADTKVAPKAIPIFPKVSKPICAATTKSSPRAKSTCTTINYRGQKWLSDFRDVSPKSAHMSADQIRGA